MIPAQLGKEGHRLLRALRDQLAIHPVQRMCESRSLAIHFGGKQIAHRGVEGEPLGIEAADELVARARVLLAEGVMQHPQRIPVVQAHGRRF